MSETTNELSALAGGTSYDLAAAQLAEDFARATERLERAHPFFFHPDYPIPEHP